MTDAPMKQKKLFRKKDPSSRRRARRAVSHSSTEEERSRFSELMAKGMKLVEELDPIMRETYRDNPEKLAEWDEIMRMRDDTDEE
jgi:hypothetical protein